MKIKDILLIITAITIVSCSDARKSETFRLLEDVESYMWDRPDSALQIVTSIDESDLTTKELRAKRDLFKWYLVMKSTNETPDENLLLGAYDYFTSQEKSSERFLSYLFKGINYILSKDYESAMKELVKAEEDSGYASTYVCGKHQERSANRTDNGKQNGINDEHRFEIRAEVFVDKTIFFLDGSSFFAELLRKFFANRRRLFCLG